MSTLGLEDKNDKQVNKNQTVSILDTIEVNEISPENFPLTEDTTCGIWIFKGDFLQKWVSPQVECECVTFEYKIPSELKYKCIIEIFRIDAKRIAEWINLTHLSA